jgi:large subunit ribosomal protein L31e
MAKKEEKKIILERTYIIPLRRECKKVAGYRKAEKAIKHVREFLARHMQVREEPNKKIKLSKFLNEAVWFRGIKKPPAKIKVKAIKYSTGDVEAELAELPKKAQIAKAKEKAEQQKAEAKRKEQEAKEEAEEKAKTEEKTKEQTEQEKKAEGLKKEERLLEKEHKEILKEKMEVEHELIKPKVKMQPRMALEK